MTEVFHLDRWTRLLGMLCGAFMLLALAACGGGGTGSSSPQTPTGTLSASPSTIALEYGTAPVTIVVSGGVKPYALTSSLQSLIPVGGVGDDGRFSITPAYAPDIATLVTLTIRDAGQTTATVAVTVAARLGVPLAISPASAETGIGAPVTFTITGGSTPYTVSSSQPSIIPNPIGIDAAGRFTVTPISNPTTNTPVVLTVRDSRNQTVTATLNVRNLPLAISPSTARTVFGVPVLFQISGGQAPYSVVSSFPSIIANPTVDANGRFTVSPLFNPPANVDATLTVRDATGSTVTAQIQITPLALSVSPSAATVGANVPVTFTITGGQGPYTVVSSQPDLVPSPTSVDAQGRFTLRAIITPQAATPVLITIRDAGGNVVTATLTITPLTPVPLVVLPSTATVYANQPVTLTILGGAGPYQAFSSNGSVLPVTRNVVGDQVVLAPANVDADTTVTITIVDSTNASVTATITVKPAPLLNTLTVSPTPATPGTGCGTAVCAGQTASATVTVKNAAGAGVQGRAVRFEVVQGNYQFITSGPGLPETLANSITVTTDQAGVAVVRLRADVNAPTQVALIRATELTSGNVLNATFVIAQFTDGAGTLTAIPTTWTVTGPDSSNCAANTPVTYYIFGGTPPYRIQSTLPGFANIVPSVVQTNGGGFTAILTGTVCAPSPGAQITITDATGRTIAVSLINGFGTGNPQTNFRSISFVPGNVTTPLGCGQSIIEQVVGGEIVLADGTITQPTFVVSTLGPNVTATISGRTITITRTATGSATSPAIIYVSNGVTTATLSVAVAQTCGAPDNPVEVLQFNPTSPLVVACAAGSTATTSITPISVPDGTPPVTTTVVYTASPVFGGITATIVGNQLTITRTSAVSAGSSSLPVIVSGTAGTTTVGPGTLFVAPPTTCAP
jgi:hypothetical protein